MNLVRCKDGWVIVDQESWDRIKEATDAGKKVEVGDDENDVREQQIVEGKSADDANDGLDKEKQAGNEQAPKRKAVRAGDETETDAGASAGKEQKLVQWKAPPKRKSVRAAHEAQKDEAAASGQERSSLKSEAIRSGDEEKTTDSGAAKETMPVQQKPPPKRKVVRAGDETETDVGGRRR